MHTKVEDAGQYTCIVTNAAGEARKHFGLSVLGKYMILMKVDKKCHTVCFTSIYIKVYT